MWSDSPQRASKAVPSHAKQGKRVQHLAIPLPHSSICNRDSIEKSRATKRIEVILDLNIYCYRRVCTANWINQYNWKFLLGYVMLKTHQ